MKQLRQTWKAALQMGLCLLLLTWIFHTIFRGEGQQAWGIQWDQLSRMEQWHQAWTIGPSQLWHALRMAHPAAICLSLVLTWLMVILGVIRWRMVLKIQGIHLPLSRATAISFISQFFSSFMLGSTGGDLIKAYYAARETHHKKTEAVVTVFVDRLVGLWTMLFFAGLMMLPNLKLLPGHIGFSAIVALILGMLFSSTAVLYLAFWGGVSRRFPRARVWLRRLPKGELLERSLDSCREFGKHKAFLFKSILISLVINTLVVFQVIILAKGMGLDISTMALFLIVPVVICISALPITPGGLGVRENLFVLMLGGIGVVKTSALSLSLLSYASALFWNLVGGIVYLGLKDKEHLQEVTRENSDESVG